MKQSILKEKCECGKPIDFFSLQKRYFNEIKALRKLRLHSLYLTILSSLTVCITMFLYYIFIKPNPTEFKSGFIGGLIFALAIFMISYAVERKKLFESNNNMSIPKERLEHKKSLIVQQKIKNPKTRKIYLLISTLVLIIVFLVMISIVILSKFVSKVFGIPIFFVLLIILSILLFIKAAIDKKTKRRINK